MHLQRAVDGLDHDRLAAFVLKEEMRTGHRALRAAEAGRRRRHEDDVLHRRFHLVDGGEIREHPDAEFMRRDRVLGVLLGDVGIFGVAREVEEADGEALIVDAVEDDGKAQRVGADDGIAGRVGEALAAIGQRAAHLFASRNDDDVRLHREAEFERSAANGGAVLALRLMPVQATAGSRWRTRTGRRAVSGEFSDHERLLPAWTAHSPR